MTEPAVTVLLDCIVIVPTTRFAARILVSAAAWVTPTTSGVDTVDGVGESLPPPDEQAVNRTQVRNAVERRKFLDPNIVNPTRLANRQRVLP